MDFLKNHGEKLLFLILAAGLGASVFLILNTQGTFQSASDVRLSQAEIRLDTEKLEEALSALNGETLDVAASLDGFTASVRKQCVNENCPHPLIPDEIKICPFCGTEQTGIGIDSDGDGITNKQELAWGMDPNDPNDVLLDQDGDGFITRVEVAEGTIPVDASSHPPLVEYLRLEDLEQKTTRIELLGFNQLTETVYSLQLRWAYPGENRWNRGYVKTGTRFGRNKEFLAEEFVEKRTRQDDGRYVDESYASIKAGRHQLQLGRYGERSEGRITESLATITLIAGPQWEEEIRVGSGFELDKKSYKVIDIQNDSVVIQSDDAETPFSIGRATEEELEKLNPPKPESQPGPDGMPMDGMFPADFIPQF